jgi:hypothetical protein
MYTEDYLDQPLYGAEAIGRAAHFVDDRGRVEMNRTYRALEQGYLDASKLGKVWVSTLRRIRAAYVGGAK